MLNIIQLLEKRKRKIFEISLIDYELESFIKTKDNTIDYQNNLNIRAFTLKEIFKIDTDIKLILVSDLHNYQEKQTLLETSIKNLSLCH
jgi:hypothetical protein